MEEVGSVIEVIGKTAVVRVKRKAACDSCNMCGFKNDQKYIDLNLDNDIDAKVGDDVALYLSDKSVFKAAAIVYAVPVLSGILGLSLALLLNMNEMLQTIMCFAFIVIGLLAMLLIQRNVRKSQFNPRIIKVVVLEKEEDADNE